MLYNFKPTQEEANSSTFGLARYIRGEVTEDPVPFFYKVMWENDNYSYDTVSEEFRSDFWLNRNLESVQDCVYPVIYAANEADKAAMYSKFEEIVDRIVAAHPVAAKYIFAKRIAYKMNNGASIESLMEFLQTEKNSNNIAVSCDNLCAECYLLLLDGYEKNKTRIAELNTAIREHTK